MRRVYNLHKTHIYIVNTISNSVNQGISIVLGTHKPV